MGSYDSALTAYKRYYEGGFNRLVHDQFKNTLFARITKNTKLVGDPYVVGILLDSAPGVGATRALAQGGATSTLQTRNWVITPGEYKASTYVSEREIKLGKDSGSFANLQKEKLDEINRQFMMAACQLVWADAGRSIGVGAFSAGVLTLTNRNDVLNFSLNQELQGSASDGTSSGHTAFAGIGYVIAINRSAGTVTVSATKGGAAGTPTSWTGTMYVFRNGDFGGTATPNNVLGGGGIRGWLPSTAPTGGDSWNGVDRSVDVTKLAGFYQSNTDLAGKSDVDRWKQVATDFMMRGTGASLDTCEGWTNPASFLKLANELEATGQRAVVGTSQGQGLNQISLTTGAGTLKINSDPYAPNEGFILDMSTIELVSAGPAPSVVNADGNVLFRSTTSDDFEHRLSAYWLLAVKRPGRCARFALNP
jgi:hypothetical protein